jgi:uncharacterized repeat protein (TIGR01451 family)
VIERRRALARLLVVFLIGLGAVLGTQLLLSRAVGARPLLQQGDLTLSKVESADPIRVGGQLVYTLTYSNASTDTLTGVVITDTLDPNVSYVSAAPQPQGGGPDAPFWVIGPLSASVSGEIVITVAVASPLANATILTNTAAIDSDATVPESVLITTAVAAPTLELIKRDEPEPVISGASLTYTLAYSNTGDASATGVVITDVLDSNVDYVSASPAPDGESGSTRFWNIGVLNPSASSQIVIHVDVHTGLDDDTTLTNRATMDSQETAPLPEVESTSVISHGPLVSVALTPGSATISAGQSITYTFTAQDGYGNEWDVTSSGTYTISAGAGGSWVGNEYTSQVAGTWTVTGTHEGELDTATLVVEHGSAASVSLAPASATVTAGDAITYTVTATDTTGNGWDATGEAGYEITVGAGGDWVGNAYTTAVAGTWTVTGTVNGVPGTATLVVEHGSAASVALTPGSATISAGQSISYTLTAQDGYGNGWDVTSSGTYTISAGAGGSWLDNAYTSQVAGTWTVTGTADVLSDTATLMVGPAQLDDIVISPDAAEIAAGDVQTYTAEAFDAFGNSHGDVTTDTVFSIVEAGHGGYWTDNVYTSLNPGDWTVQGVYSDTTDTALLTVLAPILHLVKEGAPDPVQAGAQITYTLVYSNTGNETATGVVITDALDPNVDYVTASPAPTGGLPGTPYWSVEDLAVSESGQITVTVAVTRPLPNGTVVTNRASMDCDQTDAVTVEVDTVVQSAPVLSLVKRGAPDPVEAGAQLGYTLTYTNTGNEIASGVVITDLLDENVTYVDADPPAQGTGRVRYWTIDDLVPDEPGQVRITVTVDSPLPNGTMLTNTAWLASDQTDPLSVTQETTVHSSPLLTITKVDDPDPVPAGEILYYTVVITNSGNEHASSVSVVEEYDPNVSFVFANPAPDSGTGNRVWSFPSLDVGDHQSIQILVRVASPIAVGTVLTNVVSVGSAETSPVTTTETTEVLSQPQIEVTQTDDPDPVDAGGVLRYVIGYENTGTAEATGVVITDTYDSRVSFEDAIPDPTAGDNVWSIGSLDAGDSGSIVVWMDVDTPLPNGTVLTNTVTAASNETAPEVFTTTTQVTSAPDLALTIVDQPDPVEAGAPLTYTLRYTNTGNADATGVVITATLDSNVSFSTSTPGPTGGSGQVWYWETDDILGEGGSGGIVVYVDVELPLTNGTILDFAAQLVDLEGDSLEQTAQTQVSSAPILSLVKSDGIQTAYAGDRLTYVLTYSNTGNENAADVVISDTLPASVDFVDCEVAGDDCGLEAPGTAVFRIPEVVAQTSQEALLIVDVDDPLPAGTEYLINHAWMRAPALSAPIHTLDVDYVGTRPDLTAAVVHEPSLFSPGGLMTYTLTYGNAGRMDAEGVVITTGLPLSTTYAGPVDAWTSADGQTYTHTVGDLPAGDTGRTLTFTVRFTDGLPTGVTAFDTSFVIGETAHGGEDTNAEDNTAGAYIGVPDLVVTDFTVEPADLEPNVPVTFTVVIRNQGTGMAWNPNSEGGFFVDVFTAPVVSYPYERSTDIYRDSPPIGPGNQRTVVITRNEGFTEQELLQIKAFYAKVDNYELSDYGLVPEGDETNNLGEPYALWLYHVYLPLVRR